MLKLYTLSAALVAGLTLAGACASQTQAAPGDQPRQVVVKYDDLNVASPAGAAALKSRVQQAAHYVCGPAPDNRELAATQSYKACLSEAQASASLPMTQAKVQAIASTGLQEAH